jgi:hypothetical protein
MGRGLKALPDSDEDAPILNGAAPARDRGTSSDITAKPLPHDSRFSGERNCDPVHNLRSKKNDSLDPMVQIKQRR